MSGRSRSATPRPTRRAFVGAAIVSLVILDVVLVVIALGIPRPAPAGSEPWVVPAAPVPAASEEQPSTSPTPAPSVPDVTATRILAASGGDVLWRAAVGSCSTGGGAVEVSTDGGASWRPVTLADAQPSQILTVLAGPESSVASVVFADAACEVDARRTFDAGGGWQENPAVVDVASYVAPEGDVVLGGSEVASPCAAPLQARGQGAVLCADGLHVGIAAAWNAPIPGAVAMAPFDAERVVMATLDPACAGVQLSLVVLADASLAPLACVDLAPATDLAIAADADTAYVWSGDGFASVEVAA